MKQFLQKNQNRYHHLGGGCKAASLSLGLGLCQGEG